MAAGQFGCRLPPLAHKVRNCSGAASAIGDQACFAGGSQLCLRRMQALQDNRRAGGKADANDQRPEQSEAVIKRHARQSVVFGKEPGKVAADPGVILAHQSVELLLVMRVLSPARLPVSVDSLTVVVVLRC